MVGSLPSPFDKQENSAISRHDSKSLRSLVLDLREKWLLLFGKFNGNILYTKTAGIAKVFHVQFGLRVHELI